MRSLASRKQITYSIFFFSIATLGNVKGQITTGELTGQVNTITTAVPFLMIAPDSRSAALGDAGVALSPDANSIHWNPSKLAFIQKKMGFAISVTPWLKNLVPDIYLAYLSGYSKIDNVQTIGASLRYFSLGNITFTDISGNIIRDFKPNEFAIDIAYSRTLSENFSGGLAFRYINSNLTGGIPSQDGSATKAGQAVAADISGYYQNPDIDLGEKRGKVAAGINISNIGNKISYGVKRDFIPINMRLGGALTVNLDQYNTVTFLADVNKLLVPTPPVYKLDENGEKIPTADGGFEIIGKPSDRPVVEGIFGSFSDAPGGFKEEINEFMIGGGIEYWYDNIFAIRAGYFNESKTKGNRKYFTLGAGLKYNVFGLDFAYLIPTQQNHPLQNTLRFTLLFDFDAFKSQDENQPPQGE